MLKNKAQKDESWVKDEVTDWRDLLFMLKEKFISEIVHHAPRHL